MTVYIDVLTVLNVYITYFVLRGCAVMLHIRCNIKRLCAACIVGGMCACAALIDLPFPAGLALRFLITALTVVIAFGISGFGDMLMRLIVCMCAGMLISGAATAVHEMFGTDFIFSANGFVYMDVSALVLVVSTAAVYGLLSLVRRILDKPVTDERVILSVTAEGKTAVLSACKDTGNYLCDFLTGKPVIVCREDAVRDILPRGVTDFIEGRDCEISGIRIIPAATAGSGTIIAAFRPDSITAGQGSAAKSIDALIGVSDGSLRGENFDAVINPKLLI